MTKKRRLTKAEQKVAAEQDAAHTAAANRIAKAMTTIQEYTNRFATSPWIDWAVIGSANAVADVLETAAEVVCGQEVPRD